jgi:AMP-binding enzyme/AMP-binding enzyme C-terminal domain
VGQGWGLTETSIGITTPDRDAGTVPGSVGRVLPNTELRVVDPETGRDLGGGERGELWARGPQVMAGYLGRPDATAEMIDAGGWLHTGDLGLVDADGNVFVVDRLKELIKVSAYQVAPAELEALLGGHPAVADAAVIPRPDATHGEVPVALVVPRGEVDPDELMAWVAAQVAPHKRIRAVRQVDAIPRTPPASCCAGCYRAGPPAGVSQAGTAVQRPLLPESLQAIVALGERRIAAAEQWNRGSRRVSRDGDEADVRADALDLDQPQAAGHVDGRRPRASERGQAAAADQHRRDIADHAIDEVLCQE